MEEAEETENSFQSVLRDLIPSLRGRDIISSLVRNKNRFNLPHIWNRCSSAVAEGSSCLFILWAQNGILWTRMRNRFNGCGMDQDDLLCYSSTTSCSSNTFYDTYRNNLPTRTDYTKQMQHV